MSAIENILGMLPDRVGDGKNSQIYTPPHIAQEMVDALPAEVFNKDTTFLDICCKSGIFLYKIYQKLMESPSMQADFPDETDRATHIVHKQLFGIAPNLFCKMFSTRTVYGYLDPESNIIFINEYELVMRNADKTFLYKTLQKEFNTVKFDIVIGNPPYNNDAYLDFVQLGHKLATQYTMMITPAKWQAKGGQKNEVFRREIVPYISDVVYYINEKDIWEDLMCTGGITYYLISKEEQEVANITNVYINGKSFNGIKIPQFNNKETRKIDMCLNNFGYKTVSKLKNYNKLSIESLNRGFRYRFRFSKLFTESSKPLVLNPAYIEDINKPTNFSANYPVRFSSDNIEEVNSFISYAYSKFVRYLLLIGLCSTEMASDYVWRFVPAPEAFDHIFTDAELYKKYNLTQEEINIIESVIKERK